MSHSDWQSKVDSQISWCRECGWKFIAKADEQTCAHCTEALDEAALKAFIGAKLRMKARLK
jgi:hypothetical protein